MKWYGYVIIGLLASVGVFAWMWSAARNELKAERAGMDTIRFNESRRMMVQYTKETHDQRDSIIRYQSQIKHIKDSNAQIVANKDRYAWWLKGQIRPAAEVVSKLDSTEVSRQLGYRDQAIDNCDSTRQVLAAEKSAIEAKQEAIEAAQAKEDSIADKSINSLNDAAIEQYHRAERLDKKLDNPWSFGLHGGYGATLAGGRVYAGPQIGIGVDYKIRFKRRK